MPIITADNGFEQFYERHYKMVYRYVYEESIRSRRLHRGCFRQGADRRNLFSGRNTREKWLTVTAINLCKDRLKHWFRRMVLPIEDVEEPAGEGIPEPDETLEIVKKLPTKYKDVIYLHYYMDYKTDEITAMLHKPPSTVRNHLAEARALLKKQLGETAV